MEMTYKDVEISSDDYFKVSKSLEKLKEDVCAFYKIPHEKMRWYHVVNYLKETNRVIFSYQSLPKEFNGKTKKYGDRIVTILNTNSDNNDGRRHFTALHEVTHAILHIKGSKPGLTLYSNNITSPSRDFKEVQADLGASELMFPKEALLYTCAKRYSFFKMCDIFECSHGALNTRLLNYLVFEMQIDINTALTVVNSFRYRGNLGLCWIIGGSEYIAQSYLEYRNGFYEYDVQEDFQAFSEFLKMCETAYDDCTLLERKILYKYYISTFLNY